MDEIYSSMEVQLYHKNQNIFEPGQKIDNMYLVCQGTVEIQGQIKNNFVPIETLHLGANICSKGVLGKYIHPFKCVAKTDAVIYWISQKSIADMKYSVPELSKQYADIVRQLRKRGYPTLDFWEYRDPKHPLTPSERFTIAVSRALKINKLLGKAETAHSISLRLQTLTEDYQHQYEFMSEEQKMSTMIKKIDSSLSTIGYLEHNITTKLRNRMRLGKSQNQDKKNDD